jgi:hypothetical protein
MGRNMKKGVIGISMTFMLFIIVIFAVQENTYAYADGQETYTSSPIITILTHGLGGTPNDWSNNGEFDDINGGFNDYTNIKNLFYNENNANLKPYYMDLSFCYNSYSLIETLRRKNPDSAVYVVSENGNTPYIDRFDVNGNSPTGYSATSVTNIILIKKIID